ncbi:hypothetical protein VMCG_02103 [Cytospora schulzeri]|uniref:Calcineurin-like phosphoesterase domain-containing protein n=1 Tax=Cytospora schulzeri TaxID=448051 RepID=A0A423X2Y5_9PEZI|nr:hypothetical protein VMCG_02103 [Valsa malicola]
MLDPTPPRLPRVLLAVLTIVSVTLFLSYTRISSTTYSLLWPEPEPFPTPDGKDLRTIFDDISPMSYGTTTRPAMKGMPENMIADLPAEYIPSRDGPTRRLVIVGDVHGQKTALEKLLEKIRFDKSADHLILTGDMTNKGPDSAGVLELAMDLGAHAVRGNHDDRVLLARAALDKDSEDQAKAKAAAAASEGGVVDLETKVYEKGQEKEDGGQNDGQDDVDPKVAKEEYLAREATLLLERDDRKEVTTARTLTPEQVEWLARLPIILNVGRIPRSSASASASASPSPTPGPSTTTDDGVTPTTDTPAAAPETAAAAFENLVVVHAGLVPALPLTSQDPWAVMTMRTLVYPIDDERRAAVKKYLQDQASKRQRGKIAATQMINDDMIDEYLGKIMQAKGIKDNSKDENGGDRVGAGDVALPTDGRDGTAWWGEWNRYQERLARDEGDDNKDYGHGLKGTTVVYGHDAKSGLKVPDTYGNGRGYTYGLDSGCVYGGKLSALIIEARPEGIVHGIAQVGCDKAVEPDDK